MWLVQPPVIQLLLVLGVTALLDLIARFAFEKAFEESYQSITLQVKRLASLAIWFLGGMTALQQLGVALDFVLVAVFIAGIALVVALRTPLQNVVSRNFSRFYLPHRVGDTIVVRNYLGRIVEINPLYLILIDEENELVSVPNTLFSKEIVVNKTRRAWQEVLIPISLDASVNFPDFERELLKACNRLKRHLDEHHPPTITVTHRNDLMIEIELMLMITTLEKKAAIVASINATVKRLAKRFA